MREDKKYTHNGKLLSPNAMNSPRIFYQKATQNIFMFCLACCSTNHGLALRSCFLFFYFHSLVLFCIPPFWWDIPYTLNGKHNKPYLSLVSCMLFIWINSNKTIVCVLYHLDKNYIFKPNYGRLRKNKWWYKKW